MFLRVGTALVAIALVLVLLWYLPEQISRQWLVALLFVVLTIEWLSITDWTGANALEKGVLVLFAIAIGATVSFGFSDPAGMGRVFHAVIMGLWLGSFWLVLRFEKIRGFFSHHQAVARFLGILLIGGGLQALGHVFLNTSLFTFVGLLAIVWLTDSGAYFVGKKLGRTPFFAHISPKKTVEGFIGGCVFGFAGAFFLVYFDESFEIRTVFGVLFLGIVCFSVAGDLFISAIKRVGGVKDSGKLFPGHGGALDRFDSMLPAFAWTAPFVV